MFVDIPKIEVMLSDKEYIFLHSVLDDILYSFDAFTPPQDSQSLLLVSSSSITATTHTIPQPIPTPRTSIVTIVMKVTIHSAMLQLQENEHPLATFTINSFCMSFEDGGKQGDKLLLTHVNLSVQNILLSDDRVGKASSHQYIITPKDRDVTMLNLSLLEYQLCV